MPSDATGILLLGAIHRRIGHPYQIIALLCIVREHGDTDAHAQSSALTAEPHRCRERVADALRDMLRRVYGNFEKL